MFLIICFLLLNACDDHGISTDKVISEDEIIASQELKLRKYYNRLEKRKLSLGLLRQDGGGTDTPFDAEDIVEAFEQLAFYNEYKIGENQLLPNNDMVNLGKWNSAINISVRFGNSVDAKQKEPVRLCTSYTTVTVWLCLNLNNTTGRQLVLLLHQDCGRH